MMSAKVMKKEPLLFLCHRIPFPPNKGDKIRSFNILKKLSENYDVHLGCFIDDPFDKQYISRLDDYCQNVYTLEQNKTLSKIKGLKAFVTGQPISLPYYFDRKMKQWVEKTISSAHINKVFVYSSSMAQYVDNQAIDVTNSVKRVIDFVDVDSDKWRQYAEKKSGIAKWVFNREHRLLAEYEDLVCEQFDHSIFVSPDEAQLFRDRQPQHLKNKVIGLLNGVDVDFFDPRANMANEQLPDTPFISFTGAMDYWANVDSVLWFVEHVWPKILQEKPNSHFCIVGGNPSPDIIALSKQTNITVTGRVHDVRPFIKEAMCVVAPLRIARGIQNKVLEAMSLDKSIVCTSMGMEGINAQSSDYIRIVDEPNEFATECITLLDDVDPNGSNRQWVIDNFTWQQTLLSLPNFFSDSE